MARLALAFAAGIALFHSGAPLPPAPSLLLLLCWPVWTFFRPRLRATDTDSVGRAQPRSRRLLSASVVPMITAVAAGVVVAGGDDARRRADCRLRMSEGPMGTVIGRFLGRPEGGGAPFRLEEAGETGCEAVVRAYPDRNSRGLRPGVRLRGRGVWRRAPRPDPLLPERAGYLILDEIEPAPGGSGPAVRLLRARGALQERIVGLYGPRAPVVEALVLARKEALDPALREAFARAGVAHLLAISGFHVGVVAGLLLVLARIAGLRPERRPLLAAGVVWIYVIGIGLPDAAVRAAMILTLLAVGRLRRRPVVPLGALATALLSILLVDPGALRRVGFQLSFAGSAGLILWTGRMRGWLARVAGRAIPSGVAGALAAGTAATLATLPLVAWHFGRVSLVGIPATLLAAPVASLAIPGIAATLALEPLAPGAAAFLAGGVDLLLAALVRGVEWTAGLPMASTWTPRSWVTAGGATTAVVLLVSRAAGPAGGRAREALLAAAVVSSLVLAPVGVSVAGRGTVEIVAVDVGQGDALAVRSPGGRWILVDAGPRTPTFDAGARRVVPYLRRRGVERLEAMILTHPDLDHVGGAPAVLDSLEVGGVLDPGVAPGRLPYQETLTAARERGVGWWSAGSRRSLELDGMELRVLHPPAAGEGGRAPEAEANDLSVVVLLRFGRFGALLTGDAPAAVEEAVLSDIEGAVHLLKVGHHGSATSTSRALVETLRPEVAVVPVGWRNRYGHPHPDVVERLTAGGVRLYRTDLHGTVRIRARADGSWTVEADDE